MSGLSFLSCRKYPFTIFILMALKRIEWVDTAKGIGIILVVFSHSGLPTNLQWLIFSFHMPLFFFLSGFTSKMKAAPDFASFVKKKFNALIIPYFYFSLIVLIGYFFLTQHHLFVPFLKQTIFFGWNGIALWFLVVLFCTEILVYSMNTLRKKWRYFFFLLSALLFYYSSLNEVKLPYKLDVVMVATLFFAAGQGFQYMIAAPRKALSTTSLIILTLGFLVLNVWLCFSNYRQVDLASNTLGNPLIGAASAIFGILSVVALSVVIARVHYFKRVLVKTGRSTLIILSLHQIIMTYLIRVEDMFGFDGFAFSLLRQMLMWSIIVFCIYLINKHLPFLVGRRYKPQQVQEGSLSADFQLERNL